MITRSKCRLHNLSNVYGSFSFQRVFYYFRIFSPLNTKQKPLMSPSTRLLDYEKKIYVYISRKKFRCFYVLYFYKRNDILSKYISYSFFFTCVNMPDTEF